jgi:hypothetical protein
VLTNASGLEVSALLCRSFFHRIAGPTITNRVGSSVLRSQEIPDEECRLLRISFEPFCQLVSEGSPIASTHVSIRWTSSMDFPTRRRSRRSYDNLDFQRAVQAFLTAMPAASRWRCAKEAQHRRQQQYRADLRELTGTHVVTRITFHWPASRA